MSELTIEQQIEVLEHALRKTRMQNYATGLCFNIKQSIESVTGISFLHYTDVKLFIPIFTFKNAQNWIGVTGFYFEHWWHLTEEGNLQRIEFLKRCISELEKIKEANK